MRRTPQKEQAKIISSERRLYSAFAENHEWKRKRISNERLREDKVLMREAQELRKARLREDIEFMAAKEARQQKRLAFQKERLVRQREHLAAKVAGVETRFQERTRAMAEGNGRTNANANAPTPTPTPTPTPFAGHRITNERLREDEVLRDKAQELRCARLREDISFTGSKRARKKRFLLKLERTRVMAEGNGRTNCNANAPTPTPTPTPTRKVDDGDNANANAPTPTRKVDDGDNANANAPTPTPTPTCASASTKCPVCECGRWQHSQIPRARVTTYYEDRVVQGYVKKLVARRVVLKAEAKELLRIDRKAYADAIAFLEARGLRAGPEMRVAGKRKRQLSKAL